MGAHESGYTKFTMDITEFIEEGENFIAVMVDNRAMATKWPNDRGYFGYVGIRRDVTLELYVKILTERPHGRMAACLP